MRRLVRRIVRDEGGFSLIELTIAAALLVLIVAASLTVLESGAQTERGQRVRAETLEDQRIGMERMTKEIRQALSIETASTRSALHMETLVGGVEHDVTYEVTGGVLRRTLDGGTAVPLVSGVVSDEVFCYDPPDCLLSSPDSSSPKLIEVALEVEPDSSGAPSVLLKTDVHLRNV